MKKYNLTFSQRLLLIPVWFVWVQLPDKDRKTWHEVKKGMETHEHKYSILTIEEGRKYLKCNHEGCNLCEPVN